MKCYMWLLGFIMITTNLFAGVITPAQRLNRAIKSGDTNTIKHLVKSGIIVLCEDEKSCDKLFSSSVELARFALSLGIKPSRAQAAWTLGINAGMYHKFADILDLFEEYGVVPEWNIDAFSLLVDKVATADDLQQIFSKLNNTIPSKVMKLYLLQFFMSAFDEEECLLENDLDCKQLEQSNTEKANLIKSILLGAPIQ